MRSATVDGPRCKAQREARGLTQEQLADKISKSYKRGCRPATLAHIELGTRQPSGGLFLALCKALDVSRDDLIATDHREVAS